MLVLLTEAGFGIGYGHLTRMLAVGEELRAAGVATLLIVQWEGDPSKEILEGRDWIYSAPWRHDPAAVLLRHDADITLIDSYRLPIEGYAGVANSGVLLTVLDDFYRLPYPAQLAINPNVYGDASRYLVHASRAVAGADWVIVRPPVANAAQRFKVSEGLNRVLLTLGGSDKHQLGERLTIALAESWDVTWIKPSHAEVSITCPRATIVGTQTAEGVVSHILSSDIVVCGGGQTLNELACLGAPCVAIELGDDQQLNLDFYERAGCLGERLRWCQAKLVDAVIRRVTFLGDPTERSRIAMAGGSLINGGGAKRLAEMLASLQ